MTPKGNRKIFKQWAEHIRDDGEITQDLRVYIANAFGLLSEGEDANEVFGLKYDSSGKSESDTIHRERLSFVLHWIACVVVPEDDDLPGLGLSISDACKEAAVLFGKFLRDGSARQYDAEYLRQCWYRYKHMQNPNRSPNDPDNPYNH
ncbi:MAG: hypothetical protein R3F41_00490 [Gammaproteobacteria bacterium]|nr:hypothetical protein [Pseudomonadales bacterium]